MEGWMMDQQGPDEVRTAEGANADLAAWCGQAFPDPDIYDAFYRMPLSCLAASGIPMPMREFDILFARDRVVLRAFLEKAQGRLTDQRSYDLLPGDPFLRFASKEAASWLTGEEAGPYRIRAFDGASFMVRRFLEIFQRDPEAMTEYEVLLLPRLIREYGGDSARDARLALAFSDAYYKRVLALTKEEAAGSFSSSILAEALDLARAACDREGSHKTRKNLVRLLVRYSEYREMAGDHSRALALCEEALPFCNEDLYEEESPERIRLFLETAEALAGLCLHEKNTG